MLTLMISCRGLKFRREHAKVHCLRGSRSYLDFTRTEYEKLLLIIYLLYINFRAVNVSKLT